MLPFTFRQIEVFLEVCRAGNFRGAADCLQVSQPAVSNLIKALELQLGKELFLRRRGASCVLSPDGLAFKDSAEQFFQQAQALGRGARPSARRHRPVRVFVGGHLLEDFVRPGLERFHLQHPHLTLTFLSPRSRAQLLRDIQRRRVDIVLVTSAPYEETPATRVLGTVAAGVYCRTDRFKVTTPADLSGLPFIMPPEGTPEAIHTNDILRRHGIVPGRVAATTQYHDVMVRMASEGRGALLSIQSCIDRHDRARRLRRVLTTDNWERRIYVAPTIEPHRARAIVDFLQKSMPTPTV